MTRKVNKANFDLMFTLGLVFLDLPAGVMHVYILTVTKKVWGQKLMNDLN